MRNRADHPDPAAVQRALDDIHRATLHAEDWGRTADYIPELERVDVHQFGIAVITRGGDVASAGDADRRFTIQSISKVFALTLALEHFGEDIWSRAGREPSGDPYNSVVDLERHRGIPRNPFINPGALVVVDMLLELRETAGHNEFVRDFVAEQLGGTAVEVDERVFESESGVSFTNRALANLAKSFGNIHHTVNQVIDAYVRQCAISLSCRELAQAGRYLAIERPDAEEKVAAAQARHARRVASLMLTCGQYDGSGDFAYRVGLPAKSGVGGGILAVVPNTATIAVWAPGLDENGNSLLGTQALEHLAERMDWSVFGALG